MAATAIAEKTHPGISDDEVAKANHALAVLVENGDLDRLVHLARLLGSAQDSMSDEMVGRLAGLATDSLDLLDRVNRSGVAKALPAIAALVENGDLDRLVHLARLVGSAQDSMSDEMVGRLAGLATDAMCLIDRATRTGAMERMLALAERLEEQHVLADFLTCLEGAAAEAAKAPPPKGGIVGLWELVRQPETQQTLQFFMLVGKHFRSCRLSPTRE